MAHNHSHGLPAAHRAFGIAVILNLGFVVIEAGFGLWANSLALLADAGHNLSDVLGLVLAWGASYLSLRQPTARRTYGLRRSTIIAALLNAIFLLVAIGGIAGEAIRRLNQPQVVSSSAVIGVALVGVGINTATALLFLRGRKRDLNVRGAFLHMAADAAISAGVVVAGIAMWVFDWSWVDPMASLIVVGVIAVATWGLFRESLDLALDAVPAGIDPRAVEVHLAGIPGIAAVHDLHIWAMSTTENALTVHLVKPDGQLDDELLGQICMDLREKFGIHHATIQLERGANHTCILVAPVRAH